MTGYCIAIKFNAGGRLWRVETSWSLFDIELLLDQRLPLGHPVTLELDGHTLFVYEWGLLLQFYQPSTGAIIEAQCSFWAFTAWFDHMDQHGTPRQNIIGAAGLQALEWHEQYLQWARAEELQHAKWLVERDGYKPAELLTWLPRLAEEPEFKNLPSPKGQGRHKRQPPAHILELGALTLSIYRLSVAITFMGACRLACQLRPEWVPQYWRNHSEREPCNFLNDSLRKNEFKGTVFEDFRFLKAPPHWLEVRPLGES